MLRLDEKRWLSNLLNGGGDSGFNGYTPELAGSHE